MTPADPVWVLLADDDDEMRRLLAEALRDGGYRVTEAVDVNRIPHAFGDEVPGPLADVDLIVTDVCMPGLSGVELVAALRKSDWGTPVLLISAFADDELRRRAQALGSTRVLAKPFGLHEFVSAVREMTVG